MIRMHREDLPVHRLRFRKPPGLMMTERQWKDLFESERGHAERRVCAEATLHGNRKPWQRSILQWSPFTAIGWQCAWNLT